MLTITWQDDAQCIGHDPELFAPEGEGEGQAVLARRAATAKAICAGCPVAVQCWTTARSDKLSGVWGGELMREGERRFLSGEGASPCGTSAAYHRHRRNGETPCDPCRKAHREKRARERDNVMQPCGTRAAARRHNRRGEPLCEKCRGLGSYHQIASRNGISTARGAA